MSKRYVQMNGSSALVVVVAMIAIGATGCVRTSRAATPLRAGVVPACDGDAWIDINNTGNVPVDIYASYTGTDETMLGTVQPGRTRIGLTRTPISSLVARPVGQRVIAEATSAPHPGTDRVQYIPGCKPSATGAD
jgi:hypothetical protein